MARGSAPPRVKPSRTRAALVDAALWEAAEFVAARVVVHSAKEVWAELRGFTGLDEIWGPGTEPWPNDSLMFAVAASRALRVYAVDDACCRFCGRPHADPPGDLCPAAREDYDGLERWGDDLGLTTSDAV